MVMPNPIVINQNTRGSPTGGGIHVIRYTHNGIVISVEAKIARIFVEF